MSTIIERKTDEEGNEYVAPDAMTERTSVTRIVKVEERFANEPLEPKASPGNESSKARFEQEWLKEEEEEAARRPSLAKEPLEFKKKRARM